ncbi:MAG: hypothetical protein RR052_03515 [Oscillospiraceae bacterium]
MKKSVLINRLKTLADAFEKLENAKAAVAEEFYDCTYTNICGVLHKCVISDNCLYDSEGNLLASGGLVDDLYFCSQLQGYELDDYFGTMYYPIDKKGGYICIEYKI